MAFCFNTREDIHYDHSGFYGYILVNGRDKRNTLLKRLGQGEQPNGLGWYRHGESFRPADDGVRYEYYIRLTGAGENKPPPQQVDEFLRPLLKPAERPAARLRQDQAEEEAAHEAVRKTETTIRGLLGRVAGVDRKISEDLALLRQDVQALMEAHGQRALSGQDLERVVQHLTEIDTRLSEDLARLQADYATESALHGELQRAHTALQQVLGRLEGIDSRFREDLERLERDVSGLVAAPNGRDDGKLLESLRAVEAGVRNLQEVTGSVNDARAETAKLRGQLEDARDALEQAQQTNIELKNDLENSEDENRGLNERLSEIAKGNASSAASQQLKQAEAANKRKEQQIRDLKREKRDTINEWKRRLRKEKEERDRQQKLYEATSATLGRLQEAQEEAPETEEERNSPASRRRMSMGDLESILDGAFPNLVLVQDSLESIYHGLRDYRPLTTLLRRICHEKRFNGRNVIRGAEKWREHTINKRWRIYFCKESGLLGDGIVALISDKNHQRDDEEWLIRNSPKAAMQDALSRRNLR